MRAATHDASSKRLRLTIPFILVLCLHVGAAPSHADERPGSGAWLIGLEAQQRNFDAMSAGDARPIARGEPGARVSIDRLLTPGWSLGLSAHFGGSWLDWSDPLYRTAGKIEDTAWSARTGVDRAFTLGARGLAFAGAGFEYGEARSWLHTLGAQQPGGSQNLSDQGPRNFTRGGYARLAAMTPVCRRLAICAQISTSIYGARASEPKFGTQYNWLGRSLAASVGLRFELARGREVSTSRP